MNVNVTHAAVPTQSASILTCKDTSDAQPVMCAEALMVKQLMPRPLVFKSGNGDGLKDAIA